MNFKTFVVLFSYFVFFNVGPLSAQTTDSNGLNSYSLELYRQAKINHKNIVLSPLSTYAVLMMAYEGAKNDTKAAFEKVLHLKNADTNKRVYLQQFLAKTDSGGTVKIYNAIWLDKKMHVKDAYVKTISDKYSSDFKQVNFANPASAVSSINGWVDERTHKKISEIITADDLNPSTKMLLLNAVYFKGQWLNKFDKKQTVSSPFFSDVENQYKVDFMKMTESVRYFENGQFQFMSKSYQDSDLSFCIMLPKALFGLEAIEQKLDADFLSGVLDSSNKTSVSLSFPKIKLSSSLELSGVLEKAGLASAFTSEADFYGMTETPLMLGKVFHKAVIELDEEKTEAATSTAASTLLSGLPSYKIFNADHPFLFFVIDNKSKSILFMGRFVKPDAAERIGKEDLIANLTNRKLAKFSMGHVLKPVLFVLDNSIISEAEFKNLSPNDIEAIHVYKDKNEIAKYSPKDYDGLVIITLKKSKKL
ncbi:serpin B [Pedobacter sp. UYEF25]